MYIYMYLGLNMILYECMHTSDLSDNYWTFLISMCLTITHWKINTVRISGVGYWHHTVQNEATWRTECTIICECTYACKFCNLPSYLYFSGQY